MPRPSLKAKRRAEILDAYGRCVAQHGVEGATLEKTAAEAGLARALIRHNIGNKDNLLDAFLDRYLDRASHSASELFDSLPADNRVSTMITWLFDPQYADEDDGGITNALLIAARERPALARQLQTWTSGFTDNVGMEIANAYPDADQEKINAVATGIAATYFHYDTHTKLGGSLQFRQSSEFAARLLVSTLEN